MQTAESILKTTIIASDDEVNTYEVRKERIGEQGKTGIVILLYPSTKASEVFKCDDTTRALVEHMDSFGVSCLRIVNLFSKVCHARMSTRNLTVDTKNLEYIASILSEKNSKDYLYIIAWGSSLSKCVAANATKRKILELIQKVHPKAELLQISAKDVDIGCQSAIHPLWLKIRNGNSEWILEPYSIPKELYEQEKGVEKDVSTKEKVALEEVKNVKAGSIYKVEQKRGK